MLCLLITAAIFSLILFFNMCTRKKVRQCQLDDYNNCFCFINLQLREWPAFMMSMLDCSSDELGGAKGMWVTWQNSWNKWQKLSLLLSEGACSGFGLSALPHKGPAGISAASGCWDNRSEQQHFFQNALRSQSCNSLIVLGLKAKLKGHSLSGEGHFSSSYSFYYSCRMS